MAGSGYSHVLGGHPGHAEAETNGGRYCKAEYWRTVLNANPVLALLPCVKRTPQPTYCERWLLVLFFLATTLCVDKLGLLAGPICQDAYLESCGNFEFEFGAKESDLSRRRRLVDEGDQIEEPGQESLPDEVRQVYPGLGALGPLLNVPQTIKELSLMNCSRPMCSHLAPGSLPYMEVVNSTYYVQKVVLGHNKLLLVPGNCTCGDSLAQTILKNVELIAISFVFSIVLYNIFFMLLCCEWESGKWAITKWIQGILVTSTILLVVAMLTAAWMITPDLDELVDSVRVILINSVLVAPISSYVMVSIGVSSVPECLKEGKPLQTARGLFAADHALYDDREDTCCMCGSTYSKTQEAASSASPPPPKKQLPQESGAVGCQMQGCQMQSSPSGVSNAVTKAAWHPFQPASGAFTKATWYPFQRRPDDAPNSKD